MSTGSLLGRYQESVLIRQSVNLQAFLRVIREGESSQLPSAYQMRYPSTFFEDMSKHPRIFVPTPAGKKSSAAGAYQITATTYDDFKSNDIRDFFPDSQDALAVRIISSEHALEAVLDGDLESAIKLCGNRWASLPKSALNDGHNYRISYDRAVKTFEEWGGRLWNGGGREYAGTNEQPLAPIEERSIQARPEDVERITNPEQEAPVFTKSVELPQEGTMAPAFAFIMPLLQSLFQAFTPVIRDKVEGALGKHTTPEMAKTTAQQLLEILQRATGQDIPTTAAPTNLAPQIAAVAQAVEQVKADPNLLAKVESDVAAYFDKMAPVYAHIEKLQQSQWDRDEQSKDRATARYKDAKFDPLKLIVGHLYAMLWIALATVTTLLVASAINGWDMERDMVILFVGLVTLIMRESVKPTDHRLGSTSSSAAQQEVIADIAARRPRT